MIEAPIIKEIAGIAHGFFTREGGYSDGPFRSLNCGYGSGDNRATVSKNRAAAASRLGVSPAGLVSLYQVHSPTVVTVTDPWRPDKAAEADAMVTNRPGIGIGVLSADCAPVIFAARDGSAVGIAHAGWKGVLSGITTSTLEALEKLGARRSNIVAAVGPAISARSYEVGPEFRDQFLAANGANSAFFRPGEGDRFYFDLPRCLVALLQKAGIAEAFNIDLCTYSDEQRFFSYRRSVHRNEPEYGRLISAVAIRP